MMDDADLVWDAEQRSGTKKWVISEAAAACTSPATATGFTVTPNMSHHAGRALDPQTRIVMVSQGH